MPRHVNDITWDVINAAITVHKALGPGLLESAYEACLAYELRKRGFKVDRQVVLPLVYEGVVLEEAYRVDLIVEDCVFVEIKSVEKLVPVHGKQLLTYLRLADKRVGLLLNFNAAVLKDGIERVINGTLDPEPAP